MYALDRRLPHDLRLYGLFDKKDRIVATTKRWHLADRFLAHETFDFVLELPADPKIRRIRLHTARQ